MADLFDIAIARKLSGGGSGASLPEVTTSDNGMVLTVVEGEWDKADASGGAGSLILHLVGDSPRHADKTWGEIKEAVENGTFIMLLEDDTYYYVMSNATFSDEGFSIAFSNLAWSFLLGESLDDYPTEDLG